MVRVHEDICLRQISCVWVSLSVNLSAGLLVRVGFLFFPISELPVNVDWRVNFRCVSERLVT